MLTKVSKGCRIGRRDFTAGVCACLLSGLRLAGDCIADDQLHVLKPADLERLRMDFNASRNKVRLFSVLSPT
jgi:hypothetical protein